MRATVICVVFSTFCVIASFSKTFDDDGLMTSRNKSASSYISGGILPLRENSTNGFLDKYTKENNIVKSSQRSLGGMFMSTYFYFWLEKH